MQSLQFIAIAAILFSRVMNVLFFTEKTVGGLVGINLTTGGDDGYSMTKVCA